MQSVKRCADDSFYPVFAQPGPQLRQVCEMTKIDPGNQTRPKTKNENGNHHSFLVDSSSVVLALFLGVASGTGDQQNKQHLGPMQGSGTCFLGCFWLLGGEMDLSSRVIPCLFSRIYPSSFLDHHHVCLYP